MDTYVWQDMIGLLHIVKADSKKEALELMFFDESIDMKHVFINAEELRNYCVENEINKLYILTDK